MQRFILANFSCQDASERHIALIINYCCCYKNKPIIKALGVFPTSTSFPFDLLIDINIFILYFPPVRTSTYFILSPPIGKSLSKCISLALCSQCQHIEICQLSCRNRVRTRSAVLRLYSLH